MIVLRGFQQQEMGKPSMRHMNGWKYNMLHNHAQVSAFFSSKWNQQMLQLLCKWSVLPFRKAYRSKCLSPQSKKYISSPKPTPHSAMGQSLDLQITSDFVTMEVPNIALRQGQEPIWFEAGGATWRFDGQIITCIAQHDQHCLSIGTYWYHLCVMDFGE